MTETPEEFLKKLKQPISFSTEDPENPEWINMVGYDFALEAVAMTRKEAINVSCRSVRQMQIKEAEERGRQEEREILIKAFCGDMKLTDGLKFYDSILPSVKRISKDVEQQIEARVRQKTAG